MLLKAVQQKVQACFPEAHVIGKLRMGSQDKALVFDLVNLHRMLVVYHREEDRVRGFGFLDPLPKERIASCVEWNSPYPLAGSSYVLVMRGHSKQYGVYFWHGGPYYLLMADRCFPDEGPPPEDFVATDAYFFAGYQKRLWLYDKGFVLSDGHAPPPEWDALGESIFSEKSVIGTGLTRQEAMSLFRACFPKGCLVGTLQRQDVTAELWDPASPTLRLQQWLLLFFDDGKILREVGYLTPARLEEEEETSQLIPVRGENPYRVTYDGTQQSYALHEQKPQAWSGRGFLVQQSDSTTARTGALPRAFEVWRHAKAAKLMPEVIMLLY
jgi:hypothetical protein